MTPDQRVAAAQGAGPSTPASGVAAGNAGGGALRRPELADFGLKPDSFDAVRRTKERRERVESTAFSWGGRIVTALVVLWLPLTIVAASAKSTALVLAAMGSPLLATAAMLALSALGGRLLAHPHEGGCQEYQRKLDEYEREVARRRDEHERAVAREQAAVQREEDRRARAEGRKRVAYWERLDGRTFEGEVAELLGSLGHAVRVVGGAGDEGIDLWMGDDTVVQCKAHDKPLSPAVVRELYGAKQAARATKAILVTLKGCTERAEEWASRVGIEVWDVKNLIQLQDEASVQQDPSRMPPPGVASATTAHDGSGSGDECLSFRLKNYAQKGTVHLSVRGELLKVADRIQQLEGLNLIPDSQGVPTTQGLGGAAKERLLDADEWYALARAQWSLDQHPQAIEAFREVVRLRPEHQDAWEFLGLLHTERGQHAEALRAWLEVARLSPADQYTWSCVGDAQMKCGQTDAAIDSYRKALECAREDRWRIWTDLAHAYQAKHEWKQALDALRAAISDKPDSVDAWSGLGGAYVSLGEKAAAVAVHEKLKTLDPKRATIFLEEHRRFLTA